MAKITDHFGSKKKGKGPGKSSGPKPSTSKQDGTSSDVIHIDPVDKDRELLRQFDLNWEYGPCMGISRLERWDRAHKFGLNPPTSVRDLILTHQGDKQYTECVWQDYKILN